MALAHSEVDMAWRKWMVRSVVFSIIGGCACAAWLYQQWTNPAAVRQQVIAKLQTMYPGATVAVDGARLRLLGGISLREVRLVKRNQHEQGDLAYIPSAILYHDKEKLLKGVLSFRKVELHRPQLRLVRQRDGCWNLEGVARPLRPDQPLPTIIIHQGTLVVEDHQTNPNSAALVIRDLNLTMLNDPLAQVTFEGTGTSEQLGQLQLRGRWKRTSPTELVLALSTQATQLNTALLQPLLQGCDKVSLNGVNLEGKADLWVDLAYQPATQPAWSYDVRCQVRQAKMQHPLLPWPVEDLEATLRCSNGEIRLEKSQAQAGGAQIKVEGTAWLPCPEHDFEGSVTISHLTLANELFPNLPEKLHLLYQNFQPVGRVTVQAAVARRKGQWTYLASGAPSKAALQPENLTICFQKFPYPLENVSGAIEMNLLTGGVSLAATGLASGQRPVTLQGTWKGSGIHAEASFDIQVTDLPLDDKAIKALPAKLQLLGQSFHPAGLADVKAHVRHIPGVAEFANEFHIRFHDSAINWDGFPYPLRQVSGYLDVYPRHWEFRDFQGQHHQGRVMVNGRSSAGPAKSVGEKEQRLILQITGQNIPLNDELRNALRPLPSLLKAWDTFAPLGKLNFTANIDRPLTAHETPAAALRDVDVRVDVRGCSIEPTFFPYHLKDVTGEFRYHNNRVELAGLRARHGRSYFALDQGKVELHPGGGYYADLHTLRAQPLLVDDVFLKALPATLREAVSTLQLRDPTNVQTRLVAYRGAEPGSTPELYWDGQIRLHEAQLKAGMELSDVTGTLACLGRFDGRKLQGLQGNLLLDKATLLNQPFRKVQGNFQVSEKRPEVLLLGLRAPLFGGDLAGQVRLEFRSTLHYEMNLTASQINLQEFGRHNLGPKAQLSGVAVGRLHLHGQGSNVDTLDGNGTVDVPNGRLLNLPLLLDLLKFLGLHWPDRTAFEEAHAVFTIHGRRMRVRKLDLLGSAVSLSGQGEFNLDGTDLNLDFYPSWGRIEQLLPAMVRPLPPALTKHLLRIEMRGKVGRNPGDLQFTKKPIPDLMDPLLSLHEHLRGASGMKKRNEGRGKE